VQGRAAEALPRFKAVLKRSPQDVSALTGLLEVELALKQRPAAQTTARTLSKLLKPSDPGYYRVAGLLATNGEYTAAIPMLENVHAVAPDSYEVSYNLALAYFESGRLQEAAAAVTPLTTTAEGADLRGAIEQRRGNATEAIDAYGRAVELDPSSEDYRVNLGSALLQAGRTDDAVKVFRTGLRETPDSWRMRVGLGSSLYIAERYEDSAAALLEAAERRPDSSIIYVLLANAYESAPALKDQIAATIESGVRRQPQDAVVQRAYGDLLYSRREPEAARRAYERAIALNPKLAEAHLQLGLILQASGQPDRALAEFQRAVRDDPQLAPARYRLGLAYQKLGRTREAQEEMAAFRKIKTPAGGDAGRVVQLLTTH
jgi:tetratricopeptide (TPR) repeat protein